MALPVPELFCALSVTAKDPETVAVPIIFPDAASTDKPAGNPVAPKPVTVRSAVI